MTNDRYTTRPAKPPSSNLGGWRGSPASLLALATHRPTWADAVHCRCGLVARRGGSTCYRHSPGGAAMASPARLARRELQRRERADALPAGLLALDLFRRLRHGAMALAPLALALADAWPNRASDPAGWAAAVRAGRAAVG